MASSVKNRSAAGARKGRSYRGKGRKSGTPFRREVGAVVFFFLFVFSFLGYLHIQAVFIDLFCGVIQGLLGFGFYAMPPMFLICSGILAFHRGRPVRLRVFSALLLPVPVGGILHLIFCTTPYTWSLSLPGTLYMDGLAMKSGGLLSGGLTIGFVKIFSSVGTAFVFVVAVLLLSLIVANTTFADLVDAIRDRPRPIPYEPEPERESRGGRSGTRFPGSRKMNIDIPVDDPPVLREKEPKNNSSGGLFDKTPRVPTPAEVLAAGKPMEKPKTQAEERPRDVPVPNQAEKPVEQMETVLPISREPAISKVKAGDAAAAAEEVSRNIENGLEKSGAAYQYPPVDLLDEGGAGVPEGSTAELKSSMARLEDTVQSFGIDAKIVNVVRGPSVTRYELELDRGVKLNKLTNLSDDIALSLGAQGVRIAPIPNKISVVGVEVPNKLVSTVCIRDVVDSSEFRNHASKVAFALGKDIAGTNIIGNIAKLPHLLIAGTTGSGKSVCMNSLIVSLLYKATPEEVRLIMIDPKMIELGIYNGIPHLLIPVVTDPKKAAGALQWAVTEMMKRYRLFSELNVRDVAAYNMAAAKDPERQRLPQIVIVIDELADLMLVAAKDVEESVCRIAQMARAAGMHLIIATQRPSADVITGIMKANIPSRIAFAVASAMESRIILDTQGAEKLVGRGDMLYFPLGAGKPIRVQGCMITGEEVEEVAAFVKKGGTAEYAEDVIREIEQNAEKKEKGNGVSFSGDEPEDAGDELLPNAIEVVVETGQASVSMLQRRLKLGYSRAARLVDQMEERAIVGPFEGSMPRQLLISKEQWQEMQMRGTYMIQGGETEAQERAESVGL
ncbi:MAG: DNA translocase FtsK [Oscillospiraceae bacterium]|nr:DNA translocase FtsK [Oscillospiraceae bacterium]